jgi:redox-sensitive bicupin YhaK (pirin superfamily)
VTVEIRRAGDRFVTVAEGRRTSHSFSFGAHYDPGNVGFGPLACHNDDHVQPGSGYDDHPHRDVEVVTWVLQGALSHRDSDGRAGVVVPGRVQAMSAGSGIVHAERVEPGAGPTRFVQTWVRPDEPGGDPSYAAADVEPGPEWTPVVSGAHPDAVRIGTRGATLWVARPAAGTELALPDVPRAHLFVARGAVALDVEAPGRRAAGGEPSYDLVEADAARLTDVPTALRVDSAAELLLWTFG